MSRIRVHLDKPGPWIVMAYVILFIVILIGGITYTRESSDRASRLAAEQAQYQQCLDSIPETKKVIAFIRGVRTVGAVLLANSVRAHEATAPSDGSLHLYRVQAANIVKLRKALHDQSRVVFHVPTVADCKAARR